MTKDINLKQLERKAWTSFHQDGFLDIFIGIMILGMGLRPLLDYFQIFDPLKYFIFPLLAGVILFLGKKYITTPRFGYVKFGEKRTIKNRRLRAYIIIVTTLILVLLLITIYYKFVNSGALPWGNLLGGYASPLVITLLVILICSSCAYFFDFARLHIYGFVIGLGILLAEFLYHFVGSPLDGLIVFGTAGSLILLSGLVILIRFLHKYPLPSEEASDGER